MPKKPSGIIGSTIFTVNRSGVNLYVDSVNFLDNKNGIEEQVIGIFCRTINKKRNLIFWKRNPESDLDFTLCFPFGTKKIDLVEIVNLHGQQKPFGTSPHMVNNGEYADSIVKQITKKIDHYPTDSKTPLQLLVYATHRNHVPTDNVLLLIEHGLIGKEPTFDAIFFLDIIDSEFAQVHLLYPRSQEEFKYIDIDALRQGNFTMLDPTNWKIEFEPDSV